MNRSNLPIFFQPDHEPVYKVPRRKKATTVPQHFPSKKSINGRGIRLGSPLLRDFAIHLEVDPENLLISPYPIVLEYETERNREVVTKTHIADLAYLKRDGSIHFCDVEPEVIKDQFRLADREDEIAQTYADQLGASYSIWTELNIHEEPRWSNVMKLWRHRDGGDLDGLRVVIPLVEDLERDTTIAEITDRAGLEYPEWIYDYERPSERSKLFAVKRVFSCVLHLAFQGRVQLDMSKPLTVASNVLATVSNRRTVKEA